MRALFSAGLILFLIVFLSGCTDVTSVFNGWFDGGGGDNEPVVGTLTAEVSADPERVAGGDYTILHLFVANPSSFQSVTLNSYDVTASIFAKSLFSSNDPAKDKQSADLIGVRYKTFDWRLNAPQVTAEMNIPVTIRMEVNKEAKFTMPAITFATRDALVSREIRNDPVPKGQKVFYLQDNFANIEVELNQEPPIVANTVHANLKFIPMMDGVIKINSISADGGSCDTPDNIARTVHCSFSQTTTDITEKKFVLTISYTFSSNIVHTLVVFPSGGTSTSTGGGTASSGSSGTTGPTPTAGASKTISTCSSVCGPNCEYARRNGVQYTSCSDSNLNPLFVNAGCTITLSDGSVCSSTTSGGSAVGPTTAPGASLTISDCGSSCAASCGYSKRNNILYSGCSDSNMRSLIVNPGCSITLSDGSVCS